MPVLTGFSPLNVSHCFPSHPTLSRYGRGMERYVSDPHPALAIAIARASTPSNGDTNVRAVAARPWMLGPRLGHIRVRNDEIRCELVRYVLSDEHLRTQCQQGVPPESLHLWAAAETSEPSSQGGSVGSNPIGATNQNPLHSKGFCAFRGESLAVRMRAWDTLGTHQVWRVPILGL